MNTRTKKVLITTIFICILIIVIMYFVTLKMNSIRECDLIVKICTEGYYNGTFDMGPGILKSDCFNALSKCGVK